MKQIRGKLTPDDIQPPNTRYNSGCDCVQVTADGGTTWNDAPGLDPRSQTGYMLPSRGGDNPQCDAAANMVAKLKSEVFQAEQEIAQFQMATALLGIVLVFLPEMGILVDLVLAVSETLITIGASAISAAFTDDQWDLVECILYCDCEPDGTMTADDLSQFLSDVHDQCDSVVSLVMDALALMQGFVGLSNAGQTGSETGDCSGCACSWRYRWNFQTADRWAAYSSAGDPVGTFVSGIGYEGTDSGISVAHCDFCGDHNRYGASRVSEFFTLGADTHLTFFKASGSGDNPEHMEAWLGTDRSGAYFFNYGTAWGVAWTGDKTDLGSVRMNVQFSDCVYSCSGDAATLVEVGGTGTPPDFVGGEFY